MLKINLQGTGVAMITPFRKDRSVDFGSLKNLTEHLINNNIEYLVIMGTTGESATLSENEREAVVQYVKELNNNRVPLIVGIGGNNTQSVIDSLKKFDSEGIAGILSVAPYYNKPNQNGIYLHYKSIAEISHLPIIIYNVPSRTGVNITAETTLQLANEVKNIVAVKEASGNFAQIMDILANKPADFQVISGDDAITFPLITLGATGVISVTANVFPKEFAEMVRCALAGKYAEAKMLHYKLLDITNTLFAEGSPAGVKAALSVLNITQAYLRLPLTKISKTTLLKLTKQIEDFSK